MLESLATLAICLCIAVSFLMSTRDENSGLDSHQLFAKMTEINVKSPLQSSDAPNINANSESSQLENSLRESGKIRVLLSGDTEKKFIKSTASVKKAQEETISRYTMTAPSRSEMAKRDDRALKCEAFETYIQVWDKLMAEDIIHRKRRNIKFSDIPWPLYTNVQSLSEFMLVKHEIPQFFAEQKFFGRNDRKNLDILFQKQLWKVESFERMISKRVKSEVYDDVMKAYAVVLENLPEI